MSYGMLRVDQLPRPLMEACQHRGHSNDKEFTPLEAIREWSAWELGDPYWAEKMNGLYEEAQEALSERAKQETDE